VTNSVRDVSTKRVAARLTCFALLSMLALVATSSRAQPAKRVQLRYQSDAGCPGRAAFVAEVRARTSAAVFVEDDSEAPLVTVTAHAAGARFIGAIVAGSHTARQVFAQSCSELVSALALITVLTFGANSAGSDLEPRGVPADANLPATGGAADANAFDSEPVPSAVEVQRITPHTEGGLSSPALPRAAPTVIDGRPAREAIWFWGPGVRLLATTSWHGDSITVVGGALSLEGGVRLDTWLAPCLRVSAGYAVSPMVRAAVGRARFSLLTARLDASVLRLVLGPVEIVPYFAIELGRIKSGGESQGSLLAFSAQSRPWLLLAQGVALELALPRKVRASLMLELQEPLRRYLYLFSDPASAITIARIPVVQVSVALGVGMRF
jgi:hypothetical protein